METEVKREQIGSRIRELIFTLKTNNFQFATTVGVSAPTINRTVDAKTKPKFELIDSILTTYPNVSRDWLMSGEGEMFKTDAKQEAKSEDNSLEKMIAKIERGFSKTYMRALDEKDKIIADQRFIIEQMRQQWQPLGKLKVSENILPAGREMPFFPNVKKEYIQFSANSFANR